MRLPLLARLVHSLVHATVEGQKRAVPRSSSQDRSRRRDCNVENIQEYLETRGQPRSRAEESSYILEKKAGRGIYILLNILEYESARDLLSSQNATPCGWPGKRVAGDKTLWRPATGMQIRNANTPGQMRLALTERHRQKPTKWFGRRASLT